MGEESDHDPAHNSALQPRNPSPAPSADTTASDSPSASANSEPHSMSEPDISTPRKKTPLSPFRRTLLISFVGILLTGVLLRAFSPGLSASHPLLLLLSKLSLPHWMWWMGGGDPLSYEILYPDAPPLDPHAAPAALHEHTKVFRKEIVQVTQSVFVAIGYGLANCVLIRGKSGGLIVVDTLESTGAMDALLRDLMQHPFLGNGEEETESGELVLPMPLKAIIYTHAHQDHIFGASSLVAAHQRHLGNHPTSSSGDNNQSSIEVWSHPLTVKEIDKALSLTGAVTYRRAMRQFGVFLTEEEFINAGIGPRLLYDWRATMGIIHPNRTMASNKQSIEIDGVRLDLLHAPGETKDQIVIWLPDQRLLVGADNFYCAFPNLYAIRGTETRDSMVWVRSLDLMRSLPAQYLVPTHTRPLRGQRVIHETLTNYRDAIQFVHDQTIRLMNKGYLLDDIVQRIQLPPHLAPLPYLQPFYGIVPWAVRAVFTHYMGWFSGDPADLNPLAPFERAKGLAELAGGRDNVLAAAEKALEEGRAQWALELATSAVRLDGQYEPAQKLRVRALREMAARQPAATGRNYFLTAASEAEGKVSLKIKDEQKIQVLDRVKDVRQALDVLRVRFAAERALSLVSSIEFRWTDYAPSAGVSCLHIRRGVVELNHNHCDHRPNIKVRMPSGLMRDLIKGTRTAALAIATGEMSVEGGLMQFAAVMSLFETSAD